MSARSFLKKLEIIVKHTLALTYWSSALQERHKVPTADFSTDGPQEAASYQHRLTVGIDKPISEVQANHTEWTRLLFFVFLES
jgi:hypothetical protein